MVLRESSEISFRFLFVCRRLHEYRCAFNETAVSMLNNYKEIHVLKFRK